MSNKAIMRCVKLKSFGNVAASLQHCYRERETHNADQERLHENEHLISQSTDQALGKLRDKLPEKRRKDAVIAIEYVMTASPEWWSKASEQEQRAFITKSQDWLAQKYGNDNIIALSVHRDETTPHLSAMVTPITADGRLCAKDFIGGRQKLRDDQTSYASAVSDLGLERGQQGSKARHKSIKQYYDDVNSPPTETTKEARRVSAEKALNKAMNYLEPEQKSAVEKLYKNTFMRSIKKGQESSKDIER